MISQFSPEPGSRWSCLSDLVSVPDVYPAGRLDADSEGLLLLTDRGRLQHRLTDPRLGHWRHYWVQVEGCPEPPALDRLRRGVTVRGERTLPARVTRIPPPPLPARDPPIRFRRHQPTDWLGIALRQGRNRQIRRMTAAVGHPTLRLVRHAIDLMDGEPPLVLGDLAPGCWRPVTPAETRRLERLLQAPSALSRSSRSGRRRRRGGLR
ncbi:pseudouridine synthase [Synechococcus sp. RSCCF101]|uniref:pseudouridine synthase n=1 Tax=Synechococcus sp. RSCCF101 TaxID=2511069 RepID=UPI00351A9253